MTAREAKYRPWDQDEKLGPPPWKHDDPKLVAWETAHGHDVRLKCYPELGCVLVESSLREALEEIRRDQGKVCDQYDVCDHPACASSYTAWAIADRALRVVYGEVV